MPKRARTEMSTSDLDRRRRIARAINAKISNKFPLSEYGRAYYKRGTDANIAMWGPTYKEASADQKALRKSMGYVGRGIYEGSGIYEGQGKYSVGKNWRKFAQSKFGRAAQNTAIDLMRNAAYSGMGAYRGNQLMAGSSANSVRVAHVGDETDSLIISGTEYVRDLFCPDSSLEFSALRIECNPGLPQTAPSLSQLACNYTEYEWKQLVYTVKPMLTESVLNNGFAGTGMLVYNYNASELEPVATKEDVMHSHGNVSGRIIDELVMGVECDPAKGRTRTLFTRTNPVPYEKDPDEYDYGALYFCTRDIPVDFKNKIIYELHVTYTVELKKRRPGALKLINQQRDVFMCKNISGLTAGGANWAEMYTSAFLAKGQQNNIGCRLRVIKAANKTTATTKHMNAVEIIFPASVSGRFSIKCNMENNSGVQNDTSSATADYVEPSCYLFGSVKPVMDIFPCHGHNTPEHKTWGYISAKVVNYAGFFLEAHVEVLSSTGGVDNIVTIACDTPTSGTVVGGSIVIEEMTSAFTTKWGLPVLVDSSNVVVPATEQGKVATYGANYFYGAKSGSYTWYNLSGSSYVLPSPGEYQK